MKKLLRYMKDYKKESILAPLFKLFEAVLELIVPILLAMIIDNGINGNLGLSYVLKMTILMIVLGLVGLVCSITAQYFSAKAATGFSKILREKLFSKMQSLSYNEIDKLGTASMVTQITSDVNQVQNGVNLFLRLFLRSPFVVAGALIMALIVNPKASIIFLIVISVLMILVFFILFAIKKQYKDVQNNLDVVTRKTRDNLVGVRVIRAFTKESEEKAENSFVFEDAFKPAPEPEILIVPPQKTPISAFYCEALAKRHSAERNSFPWNRKVRKQRKDAEQAVGISCPVREQSIPLFILCSCITGVLLITCFVFASLHHYRLMVAFICLFFTAAVNTLMQAPELFSTYGIVAEGKLYPVPEESAVSSAAIVSGQRVKIVERAADWVYIESQELNGWIKARSVYLIR